MKNGLSAMKNGLYRRGPIWWIQYYAPGTGLIRESTKLTSKKASEKAARDFLRKRLGQIANGESFVAPSVEKGIRLSHIEAAITTDYAASGHRSIRYLKGHFARLRSHLVGNPRAKDIDADAIKKCVAGMRTEGYSEATINRSLAALRRGFKLLIENKKLAQMPSIKTLPEHNTRTGFVTPEEFARLVAALPSYLRGPIEFAYTSAWRVGEIRALRWDWIVGDEVTLPAEFSKNKEPRTIPLVGRLKEIIQGALADRIEGCDFVFHRGSWPIGDFRDAWYRARKAAGLRNLKLLVHDLRRSGVRDLMRATGDQTTVMKISGHKTASTFRRYNIVDTDDMKRALERLDSFRAAAEPEKVVAFRRRSA